MIKLTKSRQNLAGDFIAESARPLEKQLHAYYYGHKNWRTLKDYIDACRYDLATRSDSKLHPAAPLVDLGAKGSVHGLRYDAMQYVQSASGIDGALLRVFSFGEATPQDHDLLAAERKMVLAGQLPDGSWDSDAVRTARQVLRLIELGENPNSTALQKAGHAILATHNQLLATKPNAALHPYPVGALSHLGMTDAPALRKALRRMVEQTSEWDTHCGHTSRAAMPSLVGQAL